MAAPISNTPAVPPLAAEPDVAFDAQARLWHLVYPHVNVYRAIWYCPATGASATQAHLKIAYGPISMFVSADYAVPA